MSDSEDEEVVKVAPTLARQTIKETPEFSDFEDDAFEYSSFASEPAEDNDSNGVDSEDDEYLSASSEPDVETENGTQEDPEKGVSESTKKANLPTSAAQQKNFGIKTLEFMMEKVPALKTREGRAGLVHNFLRGLGLKPHEHPMEVDAKDSTDELTCSFVSENTKKKRIELIDAGLQFNSPYPPVLRPEREVDLILSFDFSARDSDDVRPFKVRFPIVRNY